MQTHDDDPMSVLNQDDEDGFSMLGTLMQRISIANSGRSYMNQSCFLSHPAPVILGKLNTIVLVSISTVPTCAQAASATPLYDPLYDAPSPHVRKCCYVISTKSYVRLIKPDNSVSVPCPPQRKISLTAFLICVYVYV